MSEFRLNNKLTRLVNYRFCKMQYSNNLEKAGITLMPMVVDEQIGSEIVLLLFDKTPSRSTLMLMEPFDLRFKSGVVQTSHGPIVFLFFYVPNDEKPDATDFDSIILLNPFYSMHVTMLRELASQSHWHVFLIDGDRNIQSVKESENDFRLEETVPNSVIAIRDLKPADFTLACDEFSDAYKLQHLLKMDSASVTPYTPNPECPCLETPRCFGRSRHKDLGRDRHMADVDLYRCKRCGRDWLFYFYEHEAFTNSGRWFQGLLSPEQADTASADKALSLLNSLPWHFYGGSFYGQSGKSSGKITI